MKRTFSASLILAALTVSAICSPARAQTAKWECISDGVLATLEKDGVKVGYPGKTGGIVVDPASGDVYLVICDQGLWKSTDHGATFTRCDNKTIGGRCETGWCANADPAGKRLAMFMVYAAGAGTDDSGKTWTAWKNNHFDAGAVDWEKGGKTLLAVKHESGGELSLSIDAGQTWKSLGKGFANVVGALDSKTLISGKGKDLVRSEDGGATWAPTTGAVLPAVGVVRGFKGAAYLVSPKGVQVSKDQGKTWAILGSPVEALFGPFFKDEKTMMVVTPKGFSLTEDAGKTWRIVADLQPEAMTGEFKFEPKRAWFCNYGWDPQANVIYAATMGKSAYRCALGEPIKDKPAK